MSEIRLFINDKEVLCKKGERLIDVAQREGEYIPRFCYHPSLSVVASCRMCLVEIEGCLKSQTACSTIVSDGMVVKTQSKKVLEDQKAIMQFLLVNHPLHCPICDQGGECDLQDTAMGYGLGVSEMPMPKRMVKDEDLGPLVATDMSLCIHCTRCVRFGHEVAGIPDLGMIGRGDSSEIGTYLSKGLRSELSGNMIDICPVGALTSKPFKFNGRSWGFKQHAAISVHDCLGSHLYYHTVAKGYDHLSDVMRVVPKSNIAINDIWLSDRDRFSYQGIQSEHRLMKPKIKKKNKWVDISWEEALSHVVEKLQDVKKDKSGLWLSSQATMEEGYLAQQLMRKLRIYNIDYRVTEYTKNEEIFLKPSSVNLHDFSQYNTIVLLGCNIRYEQSLMAYHIKEAVSQGSEVLSLGAIHHDYHFKHECILTSPQQLASRLFSMVLPVKEGGHALLDKSKILFIMGEEALTHPLAYDMKHIVHNFCKKKHQYIHLTKGPNALGLKVVGCLPNQGPFGHVTKTGLDYQNMLNERMEMVFLHQIDPMYDLSDADKAFEMLSQAFVVSLTSYDTPGIRAAADIMLPLALPVETSGRYINYMGLCQSFKAAIRPYGEGMMGWSIYDVIASLMDIRLDKPKDLGSYLEVEYKGMEWSIDLPKPNKPQDIECRWMKIGLSSWVRVDAQVRHAKALNEAYPRDNNIWVHPQTLETISLEVQPSDKVAMHTLLVEKLGKQYEKMEDC